jgi:hypothetical protein
MFLFNSKSEEKKVKPSGNVFSGAIAISFFPKTIDTLNLNS